MTRVKSSNRRNCVSAPRRWRRQRATDEHGLGLATASRFVARVLFVCPCFGFSHFDCPAVHNALRAKELDRQVGFDTFHRLICRALIAGLHVQSDGINLIIERSADWRTVSKTSSTTGCESSSPPQVSAATETLKTMPSSEEP